MLQPDSNLSRDDVLSKVGERQWFYEFDLPGGQFTSSYLPATVAPIHATRLAMLWSALEPIVGENWKGVSAIDIGCHQGFFASHLARRGCKEVMAIDARAEHVADAKLIAQLYGLDNLKVQLGSVDEITADELGKYDIALMFGLLYHIENPVGALRLARALTRRVCVIETQVVPNMTGVVDWGSYQFQREIMGSLALIDESSFTDNPESSTTGICITPSYEALIWLLHKVGFSRVDRVPAPPNAYEQIAAGKRVMVVAHVD